MAASRDDDKFCCSICLDLFNSPVGLTCGHTFCKTCIENHWATQGELIGFSCPECRAVFFRKPELSKNVLITSLVEGLKKATIGPREDGEMPCEWHGKSLDLYCRLDGAPICVECMPEHAGHEIVRVKMQRGGAPTLGRPKLLEAKSEKTALDMKFLKMELRLKSLSDLKADHERQLATEKREKRALQRKVAEMEEELKDLVDLKNDMRRLQDENGALIRVISQLAK
ncbi:E3 ubiquitin-protein ligase TRIM7-like [Lethenteron reissneri]|uniref:E3 ubiquitin-protein ligase TRIM7-like n=1 Tax=Lethenteron reissneri TaxID=7753 RepID=UPI002AB70CB3|nr:E3 ubiquitin-protein ligase TRIM7-like [Lethenteron reissneri]